MRVTTITAITCFITLLSACGVNELPRYRQQISQVRIDTAVATSAAVHFLTPESVSPESPESVALGLVESRIQERLAERLERLAHPADVDDVLAGAIVDAISLRFDWEIAEPGSPYDTRFLIEVTDYGVEVGEDGLGYVYYDADISGWFAETGAVIYEQSARTRLPMTEEHLGDDPVSQAAARVLNLMALDELSDSAFRGGVFSGATFTAEDVSRELRADSDQ